MAKEAGIGDRFFADGFDLSGDVGAVQTIAHTIGEQDVTGLNSVAVERLQLLSDGELAFNSYFTGDASDPSNIHAHERLRTVTTLVNCTYLRGVVQGGYGVGMVAKQFQYQLDRGMDGALLGTVNAKAASGDGLEAGRLLDAAAAPTAVGNQATGLDLGVSHGILRMAFYLHVFAFTGTSVTLIIQGDDNSGFTTPTTYGTFATVSARTSQRLLVASAPERFIRWRANAGTFSAVSFAVLACPLYT